MKISYILYKNWYVGIYSQTFTCPLCVKADTVHDIPTPRTISSDLLRKTILVKGAIQ